MKKISLLMSISTAFLIGVVSVILVYRVGVVLGIFNSVLLLAVGAAMIFIVTVIVSALFPRYWRGSLLMLFIGILCGVIADATFDFFINQVDRNLLPLEIIIWVILIPAPMFLGHLLWRAIEKNRLKERT